MVWNEYKTIVENAEQTKCLEYTHINAIHSRPSALPLKVTSVPEDCEIVKLPDKLINAYGKTAAVTEIDKHTFYGNGTVTDIVLPSKLTKIPKEAFCGCKNLRRITIPKSVKKIEENTFKGCTNLTDVYFEGGPAEWENIKPETHKTEIEFSKSCISGTASCEIIAQRSIYIYGNEAVSFATIHFYCKR